MIRYVLEKTEKTAFISQILQREMGILSTDLLIFSAMASLNLSTVMNNLSTILLLTIFGLLWNILCIAFFSYFVSDDFWFEKGLVEFGNSTGVVASGLLLLRLADPIIFQRLCRYLHLNNFLHNYYYLGDFLRFYHHFYSQELDSLIGLNYVELYRF